MKGIIEWGKLIYLNKVRHISRSLNWGIIARLLYVLFEHYCGVVVIVLVLSCLVELSVSSICKFLLNEIKLLIRLFTRIIDFDLLFFFFLAKNKDDIWIKVDNIM